MLKEMTATRALDDDTAMRWELTEQDAMLRDVARDALKSRSTSRMLLEQFARGTWFSRELWDFAVEKGWTGLLIPKQYGGSAAGVVEASVIADELGYVNAPVPFVSSAVVATLVVVNSDAEDLKRKLLPRFALGQRIIVLAEGDGGRVVAKRTTGGILLNGELRAVVDGSIATDLIVIADGARLGDERQLFVVPVSAGGVEVQRHPGIGGGEVARVRFRDVKVGPEDALATGSEECDRLLALARGHGAVVASAEMIGGTRKVFEIALEHAKSRIAYGKPIGAYQAVAYRVVDIKWELESMEALVYGVAWKLDNGLATSAEIAGVKAFCGPAYERACTRSHNVLAGVGYLIEHPLHLYTRRAKVLDMWLGDSRSHLETVFESMGI